MKGWLLLVVSIFTAGIGMLVVGLPGGELTDAALMGGCNLLVSGTVNCVFGKSSEIKCAIFII